MIIHHIRCHSQDIEKNIDLIIRQNSFAPFILTVESNFVMGGRKNIFYSVLFYLNEKRWIMGISEEAIDFSMVCSKLVQTSKPREKLISLFEKDRIPYIESCKPYSLISVDVKKPWGKEIWYTGIEKRGVSMVKTSTGDLPIYYLNLLLPKRLKGVAFDKDLILLKRLKSNLDIKGDLYIELHEKKEEIYVVDEIDDSVYPSGKVDLLYGLNKEKIKNLGFDDYKSQLLKKIEDYKKMRDKIDTMEKDSKGERIKIEEESYKEIRNWFGKKTVEMGDVIQIEKRVPHSIPHGVSVVEFQNAFYERKIIAFNQKVLTQSHWDTKEAIDLMKESSSKLEVNLVYKDDRYSEMELVRFDDYIVSKIEIKLNYRHVIYAVDSYQVLYCLDNELEIETETSSISIKKGDSLFIPIQTNINIYSNKSKESSFLLAYPNV